MWVLKVKVISWPWPKVIYIWKLKLAFLRNDWAILNQILFCAWPKYQVSVSQDHWSSGLAHLTRRLEGELIVYPWSGVRPSVVHNFKHLLLLNPLAYQSQILCGASLGRGNETLFDMHAGSHDQDGRHAHIWWKPFKNHLLRNRRTDFHETWYVALVTPAHHSLYKWWPWVDLDLFYGKVKFGNLGFSIGKSENCWFFRTFAAWTWNQLKKWTYVSIEGQGHFLTLAQDNLHTKLKTCFSQKPLGQSKPNFICKFSGTRKWKFIDMMLFTWPRWLPCPYMVKTLQKSSSLEPADRFPWNLVCSIDDSCPS